jgi:hypothetical protein
MILDLKWILLEFVFVEPNEQNPGNNKKTKMFTTKQKKIPKSFKFNENSNEIKQEILILRKKKKNKINKQNKYKS